MKDGAAPDPEPSSRLTAWIESLPCVTIAYFLLTLFMTFPLVMNFQSSVPAGAVDLWQNYWNFWWWKKALFDLHQSPYHPDYLFHPTGADLVFYTHSIFNMLIAMPVNVLLGEAAAYNFCVILALWLSGAGTYLLVRELTGEAKGAFLAGLVFAFFPQHMEQTLEHLNLFSLQFIPLSLYFLYRLTREAAASVGWRNVLGLGLCFGLNALTDWHLGIKLILIIIPLLSVEVIRRRNRAGYMLRDLCAAGVVAGFIVLPAVIPLIRIMIQGETYYQKPQEHRGIDPYYLFLPSQHHPIWGSLTWAAYAGRAYESAGFLCYLGFVPVGLGAFAAFRRQKGVRLWSAIFMGSLLLALGAHPYWRAELHEDITLPFAWMSKIPLLSLLRVANRFLILTSLALSVMVGLGWAALRIKSDWKFLLFAGLILIEYLWLPFPLQKVSLSPYYEQIGSTPSQGAVLDIPFTSSGVTVQNMVAQTRHGRPIAGGYLSTLPPGPVIGIRSDPVLNDLFGINPPHRRSVDIEHLRELGFDFIVMHKDRTNRSAKALRERMDPKDLFERKIISRFGGMPDSMFEAIGSNLQERLGRPVYEDPEIIVYRL